MLSPDRFKKYDDWMKVGWCLYNISNDLFPLWYKYSLTGEIHTKEYFKDIWSKMTYRENGLNMSCLYYWAKIDNPIEYDKIIQSQKRKKLDILLLKKEDCFIAEALYIKYADNFVCVCPNGKVWYTFVNNRWEETLKGLRLRKLISGDFANEYYKKTALFSKKAVELDTHRVMGEDDSEIDSKKEKYANLNAIVIGISKKLCTNRIKNTIMNEAIEFFYDENFIAKLNSNPMLLGFNNGIYDLEKHIFRKGLPEDFVSMTVGYDFEEHSVENPDEIMEELIDFLRHVFPDPKNNYEHLEYVMKFLGSCLMGKNPEELFHLFTGVGSNGKSKLMELMKLVFGDYYATIQTTLLTKERPSSNNASPDIMGLVSKRVIVCSEPEKRSPLNCGFMKLLSGNDTFKGRNLYEPKEIEFKLTFKMIMLCNDLPEIDSNDNGTWRRVRAIDFPSEFKDDPVPNPMKPYQFKIDKFLSDKLVRWKERCMCLLIHYFKKFMKEGLSKTERIEEATREYKKNTDIYTEYFTERMEIQSKPLSSKEMPIISDMYNDFKIWYNNTYSGNKPPAQKHFKSGIEKASNMKWYKSNGRSGLPYLKFKEIVYNTTDAEDCMIKL
jgi:P4 family phage/plasmid primase-like protien